MRLKAFLKDINEMLLHLDPTGFEDLSRIRMGLGFRVFEKSGLGLELGFNFFVIK